MNEGADALALRTEFTELSGRKMLQDNKDELHRRIEEAAQAAQKAIHAKPYGGDNERAFCVTSAIRALAAQTAGTPPELSMASLDI